VVAPSHLKSLQALELAVRKGSFKGAADALAITPAAVGQRVKALEDYLGIDLLVRGRSGVRPSQELAAALPHLLAAFGELEAASRELDLQRGYELHIAAVSDFVELWLKPRLPAFRAAHPNILFCINGEGDAPMRLGHVDCQIGFGPGGEDARTDLLFRDFVLPISSPLNHERTSDGAGLVRLEGFPLLHLDFYKDDPAGISWPAWIAANGIDRTAPERGIRFQRITNALDAVAANAGITLGGLALLTDRVDGGSIALPYPAATGIWSRHGFTARFRADWETKAHLRRFRAWLAEESRATAAWLSARAA
jgi:LysR family transcriptional regulator, glycine cleavage system transcriptional activator